jgi:transcriptional repressor OPI1
MEQNHMLPEHPPSYAQSHDPQTLNFPSVPSADLHPIHHERTLPPLPPPPAEQRHKPEPVTEAPFVWPSSNPLTAYYQSGPSQLSPKNKTTPGGESPSVMDIDTPDRSRRGESVLSIDKDDLDVRIAAEALGELRAGMSFENNARDTN